MDQWSKRWIARSPDVWFSRSEARSDTWTARAMTRWLTLSMDVWLTRLADVWTNHSVDQSTITDSMGVSVALSVDRAMARWIDRLADV